MRKTIGNPNSAAVTKQLPTTAYLDLEQLAQTWLTSEAEGYPIEAALSDDAESGWRAGTMGTQVIRVIFDTPITIRHIGLEFKEQDCARTQEFLLRWSSDDGILHEILRQQYHFSPPGTISEIETYAVHLPQLKLLELTINPDIGNANVFASLQCLRLYTDHDS